MMAKANSNIPAKNGGNVAQEITQDFLDLKPDLVDEGVEVGEEVGLGNQLDLGQQGEQIGLYKVLTAFRDKNDFSIEYNEDSDISHLSQDRIDHLIEIGYVASV